MSTTLRTLLILSSIGASNGFSINANVNNVEPHPMTRSEIFKYEYPSTIISNLPSQKDLLQQTSIQSPISPMFENRFSSTMMLSYAVTNDGVNIVDLNYDGVVPTTESDEYVVIRNESKSSVDVSGYYIYVATTGTQGPTFFFPKNTTPIKPGQSYRVYTDEVHKESGGFSYNSKKAIWSNNGGLAVLKDADGKKLSEYKYTKPKPATKS